MTPCIVVPFDNWISCLIVGFFNSFKISVLKFGVDICDSYSTTFSFNKAISDSISSNLGSTV